MNFNMLCKTLIEKTNKNNVIFNEIEENSERILKFTDEYKDLLETYESFGTEYTPHKFQSYLYSKLITWLSKELDEDYNFKYAKNYYPGDLNMFYKNYKLASLSIKEKVLEIQNPINIDELNSAISSYENYKTQKEKQLREVSKNANNPLKVCKTPIDWLFFVFKNKGYKSKIEYFTLRIEEDVAYYKREIYNTNAELEEKLRIEKKIEQKIEEITFFFKKYNFQISSI